METIKRVARDMVGLVEGLDEAQDPATRYRKLAEVEVLTRALTLNIEREMDRAGREDPAAAGRIRQQRCYHPHC
ncbi:MAG: hypothetical protein AAB855_01480 [Patescibacteria group bacterium]